MENKVRVFEIAEEINFSSIEVIKKATEIGFVLKSPQSAVSFNQAEQIADYILKNKVKSNKKTGLRIVKKAKISKSNINRENEILKRLEIIKSSIAIEEDEIIELQVMKLNKIDTDDEVKAILTKLENINYSEAIKDIENYLSKYRGVVEYVDSEVQGLKIELKSLESNLQKLTEQKTEYLNDIDEFNTQYNLHLGELIKEILELKKEILYKQIVKQQKEKEKYQEDLKTFDEAKETIEELNLTISELEDALETIDEDDENYDELSKAYRELKEEIEKLEEELEAQEEELSKTKDFIEDEDIQEEYEEVKSHYEEYESEYNHIQEEQDSKIQINDEEKKELKKLFRKAARLCHPDIVIEELKDKAHGLMQKLNEAKRKQDLVQVKKILHTLERGEGFEVSSDAIEDKELLKQKISEYKDSIKGIKSELEEIKEDDTYQTIAELDSWDEYFEELKSGLKVEKDRLVDEAREVLEEEHDVDKWMQTLWDWADEHNISNGNISRKKENLLNTKILDLTNINLQYLPKEIINLENLTELTLWGCELKYLPRDIVKLDKLIKLNLRGNPDLVALENQLKWIDELSHKATVFKDKISHIKHEDLIKLEQTIKQFESNLYNDEEISSIVYKYILKNIGTVNENKSLMRISDEAKKVASQLNNYGSSNINLKFILTTSGKKDFIVNNVTLKTFKMQNSSNKSNEKKSNTKEKKISKTITKENSPYSNHIKKIENIKFEKIRKHCENLSNNNDADDMQKYLGEKGKMYKALIYSTLEEFIENLNGETITLCDWGCSQGIASILVLDYIKEKQLDIKVSDVILIDDEIKVLSRAMAQVEALAQDDIKISAIKSDDNTIYDKIKTNKNNTTLHLFTNDKMPIDFLEIEYDIFDKDFVLCVSNENRELVDEVYENFKDFMNMQDLSIKDGKIGRFAKFERVFTIASYSAYK